MRWCVWPKDFVDTVKSAVAEGLIERDRKPLETLNYATKSWEEIEATAQEILSSFSRQLHDAVKYNTNSICVAKLTTRTDTHKVTTLLTALFARLGLHLCAAEQIEDRYSKTIYTLDTDAAVAHIANLQKFDTEDTKNIGLRAIGAAVALDMRNYQPHFAKWPAFSATQGFRIWCDKHGLTSEQIAVVGQGFMSQSS